MIIEQLFSPHFAAVVLILCGTYLICARATWEEKLCGGAGALLIVLGALALQRFS